VSSTTAVVFFPPGRWGHVPRDARPGEPGNDVPATSETVFITILQCILPVTARPVGCFDPRRSWRWPLTRLVVQEDRDAPPRFESQTWSTIVTGLQKGPSGVWVVREEGLEPSRPFGHRNLNPACLPIPPLARVDP
jgi:hypothetical protein